MAKKQFKDLSPTQKQQVIEHAIRLEVRKQLKESVSESYRVLRYSGRQGWEIGAYVDKQSADKVAAFMSKMVQFETNYDPEYPVRFEVKKGW